jgi:phosphoribosylformylglycinamidine synthase
VIGSVTEDRRLRVSHHGREVADIPPESLVLGGGAPVYHPLSTEPGYIAELRRFDLNSLPEPADHTTSLLKLLESPNITSRNWIYTQYDSMVRTDTLVSGQADAAVLRIKGSRKAIAMKTDCNPRYVYLNPYRGAQIAVAESARNVVCVGAKPIAITNCLNFGNPRKPEMFWQFKESIRGIADACNALGTPVTGGNVSFYNESPTGPIYPTPVIGMLGEIEDAGRTISAGFKCEGDAIFLLGGGSGHLGGSEYLKVIHGVVAGDAPPIDMGMECRIEETLLSMHEKRLVRSAHDLSEGGLAIALAECCVFSGEHGRPLGACVLLERGLRPDQLLFGEDQSRILISVPRERVAEAQLFLSASGVHSKLIGIVGGSELVINDYVKVPVTEMGEAYSNTLARLIGVETGV